jgi:hypothetical protein
MAAEDHAQIKNNRKDLRRAVSHRSVKIIEGDCEEEDDERLNSFLSLFSHLLSPSRLPLHLLPFSQPLSTSVGCHSVQVMMRHRISSLLHHTSHKPLPWSLVWPHHHPLCHPSSHGQPKVGMGSLFIIDSSSRPKRQFERRRGSYEMESRQMRGSEGKFWTKRRCKGLLDTPLTSLSHSLQFLSTFLFSSLDLSFFNRS